MIKYIVACKEGNNAVWDEEAELPTVFSDEDEAVSAAKEQATDNPGDPITVYMEIATVSATVRKPKVTVTVSEKA